MEGYGDIVGYDIKKVDIIGFKDIRVGVTQVENTNGLILHNQRCR